MQKYSEACINTSKFAQLCKTNKRTLIHYDEIGLFQPAYTDERGYRYYSESQCDVFFTITCLKDLGMPLKEIKQYLICRNPEDLKTLLLEQKERVAQELEHLRRIEQVIHNKLQLVSEGKQLDFQEERCLEPFLTESEEEIFVTTPYLGTKEQKKLILSLFDHIGLVNHEKWNIGYPYGAMIATRDLKEGEYDQYAYFMTKVSSSFHLSSEKAAKTYSWNQIKSNDFSIHKKRKGRYAVIYLKGDYYEATSAFEKLLAFIEEQKLQMGEFCYKEAIWDELTVAEVGEYITKISIKVEG